MDKDSIIKAIQKVREVSPKRNFKQSFDLVINLKDIDIKKQEGKIDLYLILPHPFSQKTKICALVDSELGTQAKNLFEKVILKEEFSKYSSKKALKELVNSYDYFVTQANLMGQVATTFGKTFGPKAKMPNPKAGCVVPQGANLEPLQDKLKKTIHLVTKNEPALKAKIGFEDQKDEEIEQNITAVYNSVIHALPKEKNNIKSLIIKTTMGPPVKITQKGPQVKQTKKPEETKNA